MGLLTQVDGVSSCFHVQSSTEITWKIMENPEEILHSLEEFSKSKPKDIPPELEVYLSFVAKTGDPVYQWGAIKSLFREKLVNVITEFYESCPSVDIPPCPNVDIFNYDVMKNFILEKLDTFTAAPFTLQRMCELLTTPKKEYNRIDKYMRALEKNILVVSTVEPGGRRSTENGDGIMNGLESEHVPETSNSSIDINVEEMDETLSWPRSLQTEPVSYHDDNSCSEDTQETVAKETSEAACSSTQDTVITCRSSEEPYVSIEAVPVNSCSHQENQGESEVSVTITAIPAGVQKRRNSVEPVVSSEDSESLPESNREKPTETSQPETELKPEEPEQTPSTSDEDIAKPADSSSDEAEAEAKSYELPDTSMEPEQSTTETIEDKSETECTSADTTKCSIFPKEEQADNPDLEITSSDKVEVENNVESSDQETNEVENVSEGVESQVQDKEPTPMEVDEGEGAVSPTSNEAATE